MWSKNKTDGYVLLSGKARFDSLMLRQHLVWYNQDSTTAYADIAIVQKHALKTGDKLLEVYTEFLKAFYLLGGKQKNINATYPLLAKAAEQLKKIPESSLKQFVSAEIEHLLGVSLYLTHDVSNKCINHLLAADLVYRKLGYENHLFAGYRLTYLGLYYLKRVTDPETALRYFKEGEKYTKTDPIDFHRIQIYRNIALCLVEKKQYAEAIRYNKLGIEQVHSRKDSLRIGALNGNIGEIILSYYPNPTDAEPYFQKELWYRLRFKPDGYEDVSKVYSNLCRVAGYQRNRAGVISYYQLALKAAKRLTEEAEWYTSAKDIYKSRMIADTLLGDYKSALQHEFLFQEASNKITKEGLQEAVAEASVKFDSEKLKLQAELAHEQSQNSRFWIVVVTLLLIVALIGGYFLYYRQRTRKEELALQLSFEQKEVERRAELDALKTHFFTNVSHEFRTPLTLILSPLEDLQKEFPTRTIFHLMYKNAQRLLELINQLLDLGKLEAGKMDVQLQEGDLPHFIQYTFASFESLGQDKNILFQYQQSQESLLAHYDTDKIEKITANLLSNAFKFTPENGRIYAKVNYTTNTFLLEVQDFGIGIDHHRLPQIFDRFYQINNSNPQHYAGTGVGLALVKELVTVLNGTIEVESELGKGTVFRVSIPITTSSEIKAQPIAAQTHRAVPNTYLSPSQQAAPVITDDLPVLLIVEDNLDLRYYIQSQFTTNFQVVETKDGKEGLEKAMEVIPDIIICDLMMPHLDGFEFCKILKTDLRTSHIPVVMLTAKASLDDRLEGLTAGADDYLSKPFNTNELQIRVQNLIKIRENLRQKYSSEIASKISLIPTSGANQEDLFLLKINAILDQNIANTGFETEVLAESLNITTTQLRRKLKALTNQTTIEYIRNYRLEKAAELLSTTQESVSEIAFKVGFESLSYFSKVFQERFNKTPSERK